MFPENTSRRVLRGVVVTNPIQLDGFTPYTKEIQIKQTGIIAQTLRTPADCPFVIKPPFFKYYTLPIKPTFFYRTLSVEKPRQ